MCSAVSRRTAEETADKPHRKRKFSRFRTELSLAGLLHHQGLSPPPIGVGRVHRLGDDERTS